MRVEVWNAVAAAVDSVRRAGIGMPRLPEAMHQSRLLHDVVGEVSIVDLARDDLVAFPVGPDFVSPFARPGKRLYPACSSCRSTSLR
jgi:hypothetical protein